MPWQPPHHLLLPGDGRCHSNGGCVHPRNAGAASLRTQAAAPGFFRGPERTDPQSVCQPRPLLKKRGGVCPGLEVRKETALWVFVQDPAGAFPLPTHAALLNGIRDLRLGGDGW